MMGLHMTVEIKKGYEKDKEEILALLSRNFPDPKEHWQKLFAPRYWEPKNDFLGFVLVDNAKIVGFMGIVLNEYRRSTTGEVFNICQQIPWAVDKPYRHQSLALLRSVLQLPNVAAWTSVTNFAGSVELLKRIGFQTFQDMRTFILPLPSLQKKYPTVEIITSIQEEMLTSEEKSIYKAHLSLCCQQLLIKQGSNRCHCILVKGRIKRLFSVAKFYYMSNPELMNKLLPVIKFQLCRKLRVIYLIFEGDLFKERKFLWVRKVPLALPRLFKSEQLSKEEINLLYSEFFILGL